MKKALFDSVERTYINNHYAGNKIIHPKNRLIENYELAKAINSFKKAIKQSNVFKAVIKILDYIANGLWRSIKTKETKEMKDTNEKWQGLKITKPPDIVGGYQFSSFTFHLDKKPKAIHRFFCKLCLGWTWYDNVITQKSNSITKKK